MRDNTSLNSTYALNHGVTVVLKSARTSVYACGFPLLVHSGSVHKRIFKGVKGLSLLILLVSVSGCETMGRWTDNTMAWADRTMPTYDDWFGEEKPAPAQNYTQRPPVPVTPVQAVDTTPARQPLTAQPEVYYDNSERGHSFLGQQQN